jgi:hypothetical protein
MAHKCEDRTRGHASEFRDLMGADAIRDRIEKLTANRLLGIHHACE